jgi:hypothetical protein
MATIVGTSGDDTLNGINHQDNTIYGDTSDTADPSTPLGNDTITGGSNGTNLIFGDAETLMGAGTTGGNDTLIGGTNSTNTLVGDADTTLGAPHGGNDTLIGGVGGVNYLIGDFVTASGGATGGNDRLVSAANTTDYMWGDFQNISGGNVHGGADTFVFGPHNGNDFIMDFNAQDGDIIEINSSPIPAQAALHVPQQALDHSGGGNFPTTFADLNIQEVNGNSVIQFDAHDSVTVMGVTGLTADNFSFVA